MRWKWNHLFDAYCSVSGKYPTKLYLWLLRKARKEALVNHKEQA